MSGGMPSEKVENYGQLPDLDDEEPMRFPSGKKLIYIQSNTSNAIEPCRTSPLWCGCQSLIIGGIISKK
jgi:hypothetical protein